MATTQVEKPKRCAFNAAFLQITVHDSSSILNYKNKPLFTLIILSLLPNISTEFMFVTTLVNNAHNEITRRRRL